MSAPLQRILQLLHLAENLKFELRHSWLSNGRRESVAEHTWRLALMVMLLAPYLKQPVDEKKALKMALIHDLVEAITGDIPAFTEEDHQQVNKYENECRAIEQIRDILGNELGEELYAIWHEFEDLTSQEAKFVKALDKMECQLQHNEADIDTWNELEKQNIFSLMEPYCNFDPTIKELHDILVIEGKAKLQQVTYE